MTFKQFSFTLIALAVILLPKIAPAETIVVSSAGALQQALDNVSDGGVIELAAGTYSAPNGGWTIYTDLSGGSRSFTVRAAAGANVVLTGNNTNRILTFTTPKLLTFERITFTNGLSTEEFHGGAISMAAANANFIQCVFQNNSANPATTGGGAVWIDTSTVNFTGCVWQNNTSKNYAGAFSAYRSRVYVRDNRFTDNRTNLPGHSSFNGGGCIHGNASTIQISNTRFENNQAGYVGGAIYVIGPYGTPDMNLLVDNSLFTGNIAVRDPKGTNVDPTNGGAVFMEDNVHAQFLNCRFTGNTAQQGGAIATYRGVIEIRDCTLLNNLATGGPANGEGLGGHIFILSDDNPDLTTDGGKINRPSGQLTVVDTLIRGQGATVPAARQGGGIFVAGDMHAAYGITVQPNGTPESNHALVTLKRVAFADLVTSDSSNGTGGAITGDFITLNADSCIVEKCSSTSYGGGFEFIHGSNANISNSTFSQNTTGLLGGALTMFGGMLNLKSCNLVDNQITGAGGGSALFVTADPGGPSNTGYEMTGAVENCVISNNSANPATLYDGYRSVAPFNRLQYKGNQIYPSDRSTIFIDTIGQKTVAELNALTVQFPDGTSLAKGVSNIALTSPASVGAILMVPQTSVSVGAPGETLPVPAYIAYASSGGTPTIDTVLMKTPSDVFATTNNNSHSLVVGGNAYVTTALPGRALNISTRLPVGTGQQVLIGGFIIQGPNPKTIMLRGIGPSLPLAGTLPDPYLELHEGAGPIIATNDNWRTTNQGGLITSNQFVDILASTIPPSNNAESAIIAVLKPGSYTAVVRGANNETGIAVIEGYDLDPDPLSKLANISTRGFIQTADNVMIGGFIFGGGTGSSNVVIRGIGPSLGAFGVTNPLIDPMLELHNSNGTMMDSNDDWKSNQRAIEATGLQPAADAESAIALTNVPPGAYTAVLRGKNDGVGVGVVEVYVY